MIYKSLICLADDINEYLKSKLKVTDDKVVLSGIVNQDGSVAVQGENKVLITLINIEKETIGAGSKVVPNVSQAVTINLYVLFSAYFSANNYGEALRFLSFIVSYFQKKNVFTKTNTPGLEAGINKLILEMESLSAERLNNVWATLGAKYMPSVMYKIRMLTYDDAVIHEFRPAVSGLANDNTVH